MWTLGSMSMSWIMTLNEYCPPSRQKWYVKVELQCCKIMLLVDGVWMRPSLMVNISNLWIYHLQRINKAWQWWKYLPGTSESPWRTSAIWWIILYYFGLINIIYETMSHVSRERINKRCLRHLITITSLWTDTHWSEDFLRQSSISDSRVDA